MLLFSVDISIHAPPRGATSRQVPQEAKSRNFNSRPSARGDLFATWRKSSCSKFQFTPLREGRHAEALAERDLSAFQFTPLREGRLNPREHAKMMTIYFNSRPSARGDAAFRRAERRHVYFNSRPSARGDALGSALGKPPTYFNSRPSARGDFAPILMWWLAVHFNSRPSARGDLE